MKDKSATLTSSPGRRAASYWYVDGLPEIVFGSALLIFGAAGLFWITYAPTAWVRLYFLLVAAGFLLLHWKSRDLLDFLKSRVTYPRTGYAQPPDESVPSCQPLTLLSLRPARPRDENVSSIQWRTALVIWYSCMNSVNLGTHPRRWLVPFIMATTAAALYAINRKSERPFRLSSVIVLALTGLPFLWVDVPAYVQALLPLLLTGAWMVAQGGWTLLHYLHDNPYPTASEGARA